MGDRLGRASWRPGRGAGGSECDPIGVSAACRQRNRAVVLSVLRDDFGEIVNRLGIIEVLRRAWKPLDGRDLAISVHAGDRNRESRGMRFIVNRAGEPLCCVKRLPLAGPYDPRAILTT